MTEQMLKTMLERCGCEWGKDGAVRLAEGRTLNLYTAHDGVSLHVSRVVELRLEDGVVEARDAKGELFLVALADLFAASASGTAAAMARKAGFLG